MARFGLTLEQTVAAIQEAHTAGDLSATAVENLRTWLVEPQYTEYAPQIIDHVIAQRWRELDDVFWTTIPFGTAGRRGRMYPIGTNAINDRTMAESAQGLADYVKSQMGSGEWAASLPLPLGEGRGEGAEKGLKSLLSADTLEFARELRQKLTDAERIVWELLRDRRLGGYKFRRQYPLDPYILDFYCHEAKLAVELDGGRHNSEQGREHDYARTQFLNAKGIRVVRVWNHEVLSDTDVVIEAIWNALNHSTLTLALSQREMGPACAVACDTRHRSRHFAELCAEIMVGNGFEVIFFDGFRATPELSFTVRNRGCACGIMISASHNPPSDNAIKVFWSTGGQLRPPHDEGVIECVQRVTEIRRVPFAEAVAAGRVQFCQDELDPAYQAAVLAQSKPGPRDLKILYSPLHGVGLTSIVPILAADGFDQVEIFQPHATPDGDFPNVPQHVANPENPAVFDAMIEQARKSNIDIILASDPDADRIGCAAPLSKRSEEQSQGIPPSAVPLPRWLPFTGNQIGVLLGEFLLRRLRDAGKLTPEHYFIKTLVTGDMICRIAEHFGVRAYGDVLTGFKWIGGLIDEIGPEKFVFGFEEAHGYLAGTYARDKDGAVAAMLLAELAAECKAAGRTLHEHLDQLYTQYGCHLEKTVSLTMPGAGGMARMKGIMEQLRTSPPRTFGGLAVRQMRDYLHQVVLPLGSSEDPPWRNLGEGAGLPKSDLLIFDLDLIGNRVAVRPSGTEPKIKFYLFTSESPAASVELQATKGRLLDRLARIEADFLKVAS